MANLDFLTSEEKEKVQQFMEITNTKCAETAHQLLSDSNWRLDSAIETFFIVSSIDAGEPSASDQSNSENNRNVGFVETIGESHDNIQEISAGYDSDWNASHTIREPLMTFSDQPVPDQLNNFISNFHERYCTSPDTTMPTFYTDTLQNAIDIAFGHENENLCRPLALFLNNEKSRHTENFIKSILCNPLVCEFLREKFILFPWDTTEELNKERLFQMMIDSRMRAVCDELVDFARSVDDFPVLVIVNRKRYSFEIINQFNWRSDVNEAFEGLHETFDKFKHEQLVEISKEIERKKEREIFDQQRADYDASLQADLEKKKRKVENKVMKEKEKNVKEAKDKVQQEAEEEKVKEKEKEDQKIKILLSKLPKEPEASNPTCVTVQFRFPDGTQGSRRFLQSDRIQIMLDYLTTKRYSPEQCRFFNSEFPRKDIMKCYDCQKSFGDVNWPKRETVWIVLN
ncbi:CRE-UBC-23 protein [Caenorhabditis remanei]|uniref:CRE-UBC-23 protein n=1 Tax=Caenorhabditis remanei TaxID=31234 RepID=E3NDY1_CAERE|nr:CRE-UBC-23 protein [Caenorhabditis remanei]